MPGPNSQPTDFSETVKTASPQASSLSKAIVRGTAWITIARVAGRLMGIVKTLVLAKLLLPEDFGLFGITTIVIATLNTFSEIGINTALVQRKGDISEHLNTAWMIRIIRAVVLAAIIFISAPLVARFFDVPKAIGLLQVMSIAVLLEGINNVGIIYFQKDLKFDKEFLYRFVPSLIGVITAVFFAYVTRSVWAMVFAALVEAAIRVPMSYILHPYRPRFIFHAIRAGELLSYGKWLFASSIITCVGMQLDSLMVGRLLGVEVLGLYAFAYRLSVLPAREMTTMISRIALPSYSKLQESTERVRSGFNRISQLTVFVVVPICIGAAVVAPQFFKLVLGEKWIKAVYPLQLLMVAQAFKSLASTGSALFLGAGKPKYEFYLQLIRASLMVALLYPLIRLFGLSGASSAVVISSLAMLFPFCMGVKKVCLMSTKEVLLQTFPTFAAAVVTAFLVYGVVYLLGLNNTEGVYLIAAFVGTTAGFVIIYLCIFAFISSRAGFVTVAKDIKMLLSLVEKKIPMLKVLRKVPSFGK